MSRVLIMAGGTGGHVIPGLAVAEVLRSRGAEVCWLGTSAGIESSLVPAADIPLHTIAGRGLRSQGWPQLATAPFRLLQSLWQAWVLLRRLRPAAVLGMGGYAAGPGGVAAWLMRMPLILHEQNRVTGLTNRLLRPLAKVMLFGFPHPTSSVGNTESAAHVVGNPVSQAMGVPTADMRPSGGPLRVLVLGGSQGARALNRVVVDLVNAINGDAAYELWHQCGSRLLDETRELYQFGPARSGKPGLRLDGFIDDMASAYHWADLIVARAGALTISELCVAHKPSILVPLPSAVDDHQTANASYLVEQDAAILLPQAQLSVASLRLAIETLADDNRRQEMAEAVGKLARTDAAQRVADICLEWCDA